MIHNFIKTMIITAGIVHLPLEICSRCLFGWDLNQSSTGKGSKNILRVADIVIPPETYAGKKHPPVFECVCVSALSLR